jgi:hypothetical protein
MKRTIIMLSLLAAVQAFADKPKQRVAVFPSVNAEKGQGLQNSELDDLTDKAREIAANVLTDDFTIMKPEAISKAVGGDSAFFEQCKAGSCVGDFAKKAKAQYGARCDILKRGNSFALKFELYGVEEDETRDIFIEYDLKNFKEVMAKAEERIPASFRKILPKNPPSMPQNFIAKPGNRQAELSWKAPASDGGSAITGYEVSKDNGSAWVAVDAGDAKHVFDGLENGKDYSFKVRAVNAAGEGAEASAAATPSATPSAPQNFKAAPGDGRVEISWEAPLSDGGSPITGYEVSSDGGYTWMPASGSAGHAFTGLENNAKYTFKFRAVNANGTGVEATIVETPGKPELGRIPAGIEQPQKSNNALWLALALDAAGAGFVIYGITQHFKASKAHDDYMGMQSGSAAELEKAWKKVDDAKSSRNLFYIIGGAALGLGIGIHIVF